MTTRRSMFGRGVLALAALVTVAACADGDDAVDSGASQRPTSVAPDETTAAPGSTGAPTEDSTADSTEEPTGPAGQQPEGFTTVTVRITEPDGEVCEVCMWLADDPDERGRGLMGVTDLGDAVGMAFLFEGPTAGAFYMFQTPSPLSIAWFAPDGTHVGSADMDPCVDRPAGDCPLYSPGAEYDVAIEVFDGGLEPLGLVAGSTIELIEGSEAERCPVAG